MGRERESEREREKARHDGDKEGGTDRESLSLCVCAHMDPRNNGPEPPAMLVAGIVCTSPRILSP